MKKDEQGRFRLKKRFFIKNLWGVNTILIVFNIFFKESVKPDYPENSWNLFWGTLLAPLAWLLAFFFFFPVILFSEFCFYFSRFLFKQIPVSVRKKKKILIAPWQILSQLFIIWLASKNNFAVLKATPSTVWWFLKSFGPWIIALDILLVLSMAFSRTESLIKIRKSIKRKTHIPIIFEEK